MKKALALLLVTLFLSFGVVAKTPLIMVAESPDKSVRVTLIDELCTGKAADLLGNVPEGINKAIVISRGVTFEACWKATPEGVAILLEDGTQGLIGYEHFVKSEEV